MSPSTPSTTSLFTSIQSSFPTTSPTFTPSTWQILLLAALTAGTHPEKSADFYKFLISKPEYASPEQRKALTRRLRETLMKLVPIVGVVKPLEAVFCLAEVEREEDKDYSFSRENWHSGPQNQQRGREWLAQIYRHNHAATEKTLSAHRDFDWLSIEITYGLFLSDHSILGPVETELVVLAGIMMQNLPRESAWHLRGARRIGISSEDCEKVQQCIEKVAEFCGLTLDRLPRVKDIEHEVAFEEGA